ncbi:MAG: primosomal protein N' [Bacteroidales bacterium]|nr:primosomal protein N' [Bacteroidales bacterium]
MAKFANVILPLPISGSFTYSVPSIFEDEIEVGSRVLVQFGKKNYYTGIVELVHNNQPSDYEVKEIMMVLDAKPIVRHPQLKLWNWLAEYYLCSVGEVYKAAVPSGLKVESETYILLNSDYEYDENQNLTERMALVIQLLDRNGRMKISEIERETGFKNLGTLVNKMLEMGLVLIDERIVDKYRARKETLVRLNCDRNDNEALHGFFDIVKRARQQEKMLIAYLDLSAWMQSATPKEVLKSDLLERSGASPAVLKGLVDKGVLEIYKKEINRFTVDVSESAELPQLSNAQLAAYNSILDKWKENKVTLLRGVTGSGKTEIYSHLINDVLNLGQQVLFLVPEISLTTQLTSRLQKIFGKRLLIYHSKFSDNERVDVWKKLLSTHEPLIVLGVRSSVFLPFAKLGLVIVDEEHESSYKQYDPAPRYNARDAAIVLASMHGAMTLLGSATPAVETYYKAKNGRFGLVELLERFDGIRMPEVKVVDMRDQRKRKECRGLYSNPLLVASRKALGEGKQVIMFQNRRGYAPMVECKECAWVPKCKNCDVSLVFHRNIRELRCHYCGYSMTLPNLCPVCGQDSVETYGYGTERIADDLNEIFNEYRVARMDLDTTRNKDAYEDIIDDFSSHKTDILVGTQMVTKGLDFERVRVVGVLNADSILNYPDFRSNERAFNMIEQVAGRAGRKNEVGEVYVQTTDPNNQIIEKVKTHDYEGYYDEQIDERQRFAYPPFTKIVNIYLKHKDERMVNSLAVNYVLELRKIFGNRVLGPEKPIVGRVANYYIQSIMLKIEANASMRKVKDLLRTVYERVSVDKNMRSAILYYDVDPV